MSEDTKKSWDRYTSRIGLVFSFIAIVLSALSYNDASKSLKMAEKVHSDRYAGVEVSVDYDHDYETKLYKLPDYGDQYFVDLEFHCIAINNADRGAVVKDVRMEVLHGENQRVMLDHPLGIFLDNGKELAAEPIAARDPLSFTAKVRARVTDGMAKRMMLVNKGKSHFNFYDMKTNLLFLAAGLGEYTMVGDGNSINPESTRFTKGRYRIRLVTNDGEYRTRWLSYI